MAVQLGFALDDVLLSEEGYAYSPQYAYETTRDDPGYGIGYTAGYADGYTAGYAAGAATVSGTRYRMRAFDNTLSSVVYWTSTVADITGASYTGPGPLTSIVISKIFYQ